MFSPIRRPAPDGGAPISRRVLIGCAVALTAAASAGYGLARWTAPSATTEVGRDAHADEAASGHVEMSREAAARLGIDIVLVGDAVGGELSLPGRVSLLPGAEAAVEAPVGGVVTDVHVGPGDPVRRGTVLVTLQSAEGAASRPDVDAALANVEAARAAERRDRTLFEQGWVAEARLEVTAAETRRAEAQLSAAQARAATFGTPAANGRVLVRAPIDGVVTDLTASPGQVLRDESLSIARIADPRRVELAFEAPPRAAGQIRSGDQLTATIPGGQPFAAVVTAIAPVNESGVVLVRARPSGLLPAVGTVVSARVVSGGGGMAVPVEAVQSIDGIPSVFVYRGDGFQAVPVVTGATSGGLIQIVSGLAGDEEIAGRNAFLLKAELGRGEAEHAH
jgi:membrane fusion protein, heavy metal efflux system